MSYYEEDGCCLTCESEEKEEGCLCYECKCTKCDDYLSPSQTYDVKGHCRIALEAKSKKNEGAKHLIFLHEEIKKLPLDNKGNRLCQKACHLQVPILMPFVPNPERESATCVWCRDFIWEASP